MDFSDLARRYGNFYVPAFAVRLSGKKDSDLVRDAQVAVTGVEVDLSLGASARFSFTIANSFDVERAEFRTGDGRPLLPLLAFGAEVSVAAGYGDARTLPDLVTGIITEIGTSFAESGSPELTVGGHDHLFPLTVGTNTRTWNDARDSDAVQKIATSYNLDTDLVPTPAHQASIAQNQKSDFDFIQELAKNNKYELYVTDRKLRFGPRRSDSDPVATLRWGDGLLSFKPEANIARQVGAVEVYGWDVAGKRPIVGRARNGDEPDRDPRGTSAADLMARVVPQRPTLRVRRPVYSQAEADRLAKAELKDCADQFLTGDGESLGLPEIRPDRNVALQGLGATFSKKYYVQQATHRIGVDGYRTRFKVSEPTLPARRAPT
jgi:phage protein D